MDDGTAGPTASTLQNDVAASNLNRLGLTHFSRADLNPVAIRVAVIRKWQGVLLRVDEVDSSIKDYPAPTGKFGCPDGHANRRRVADVVVGEAAAGGRSRCKVGDVEDWKRRIFRGWRPLTLGISSLRGREGAAVSRSRVSK